MALIHDKIRHAIADRGVSVKAAAEICGIKYRTLHSALNDERDVSNSTLQALSAGLDINFGYFSDRTPSIFLEAHKSHRGVEEQGLNQLRDRFASTYRETAYSGGRVTLASFLNWWVSNNGRLENFDQIAERVDIFDPPNSDSQRINPVRVGAQSLATKCFELEEADHLHSTLAGFSTECNERLVSAHLDALKRGEPVITHPTLDEKLRDGRRFSRQYRRVLAPLYLPGGRVMVINYSEDIV